MKDFESLMNQYHFNNSDLFRYFQLRTYFQKYIIPIDPILIIFLKAYKNILLKGIIGRLYRAFSAKKSDSTEYILKKMGARRQLINFGRDMADCL